MEHPEEKKPDKPDIELKLTPVEMTQILDGQEFIWEVKRKSDGKKVQIHVHLDKEGAFWEE